MSRAPAASWELAEPGNAPSGSGRKEEMAATPWAPASLERCCGSTHSSWLCVQAQGAHQNRSAGRAGRFLMCHWAMGSQLPPWLSPRAGAWASPCSHVPAKMGFHLLRGKGGDGGTCSGFTFPGTESGLVPRLFQQLKERKGMFLSFPDTGRGFCSHQGGADAFPSPWLPAWG